jgi:LruC domain-containing protein
MKTIRLLGFVIPFVVLASCSKDDLGRIDSTVEKKQLTGTGFNFSNSTDMTVSLTVKDLQDAALSNTGIDFYDQNPKIAGSSEWKNITPFSSGQTNQNGTFTRMFTLGTNVDTIYIYIKNLNYPAPFPVLVSPGTTTLSLHPTGYSASSNTGALKVRYKTYPTNYAPWQYTIAPFSASSNLWVLGNFDTNGYPAFLDGQETESADFTAAISAALPERKDLTVSTPALFSDPSKSNIKTTAPCQIWVSFLSEGAAYTNSMGYFYYPTGSTPATIADIGKKIVIFPNASGLNEKTGGVGSMIMGDRVRLMYYDTANSQWTDIFPAGITISWFIIQNSFNVTKGANKGIGATNAAMYYSIPSFNSDNYQHNILLLDQTTQKMVIGFEDQSLSGSSDRDFNDVVFSASANPISAIDPTGMLPLRPITSSDRDGDGVTDANDAYPDDPQRAYDSYYPTSGTGTLAFEDHWPSLGDYDFNDLIMSYRYHLVLNASGSVKDVKITYTVNAVGAKYKNGFGIQFGTAPGNISSVSGQMNMNGNTLFDVSSTGYENGQSYAVIPVFPDAHQLFGYTGTTLPFINTGSGTGYVKASPVTINLSVTFGTPVPTAALGSPPYNVFLVANQERGREVHLAGQMPTSKAASSLFGTGDDKTNGSTIFYKNSTEFPWALDIPSSFQYPIEYTRIDNVYMKYDSWATSLGGSYKDWYSNSAADYRNDNKIYK